MAGTREGSLLATIDRTVTAAGARLLADDLASPLTDKDAILDRLDLVDALARDALWRSELRGELRALPDPGRALGRLVAGRGGPRDQIGRASFRANVCEDGVELGCSRTIKREKSTY